MAAPLWIVTNGPMVAAAAPVVTATGSVIKTHLQIKPAAAPTKIRIVEWGCSFDASAAATPGKVELVECDVAATVTAFVAADVQLYNTTDTTNLTQSAGTGGIPLNLGTSASGYGPASAEGTVTATRMADAQLVSPTIGYSKQWPLGHEFECTPGKFLRVRATFAASVGMYCYVVFEA